jgi:steroid delta-isomerase-like uncharacterized protein
MYPASAKDGKALVRRFYEELYDRRNPEILDEVFSPEYVHHFPDVLDKKMGFGDFRKRELQLSGAFPDRKIYIEDQIAENDRVATRLVMRGTHTGDLPNIPATGKKVEVDSIVIHRIEDGRIAEGWESYDSLGMMMQLDVIHMVSTLGKSRHGRVDFPPIRTWPI